MKKLKSITIFLILTLRSFLSQKLLSMSRALSEPAEERTSSVKFTSGWTAPNGPMPQISSLQLTLWMAQSCTIATYEGSTKPFYTFPLTWTGSANGSLTWGGGPIALDGVHTVND